MKLSKIKENTLHITKVNARCHFHLKLFKTIRLINPNQCSNLMQNYYFINKRIHRIDEPE